METKLQNGPESTRGTSTALTNSKLSQELSQKPRPRRESNGHVGNENPHDGVVSLPHVVVWLAFKSLVSTNSTTRAWERNFTGTNNLRKHASVLHKSSDTACWQECRHFSRPHAHLISFRTC